MDRPGLLPCGIKYKSNYMHVELKVFRYRFYDESPQELTRQKFGKLFKRKLSLSSMELDGSLVYNVLKSYVEMSFAAFFLFIFFNLSITGCEFFITMNLL